MSAQLDSGGFRWQVRVDGAGIRFARGTARYRTWHAPLLFTPDVPQPLYNHIANTRGDNRDNQILPRKNVLQVPQQTIIPSASAAFHLTHQKV
jgi:hypothetical protein